MYKMVQELKEALKERLKEISHNEAQYKPYITQLIVQGLLRMMERNVAVEAPRDHADLVSGCFR